MVNHRREINVYKKRRVMKKLKFIHWRNAAIDYLISNGPAPAQELLDCVMRRTGRPFSHKKPTINQASSVMICDDRFVSIGTTQSKYHAVCLWGPNPYHPETTKEKEGDE
jgi:hypothetical protein